MKIFDANVILRYVLNDNPEMALIADTLLKSEAILVPTEVLAEVVYVLSGVYAIPRNRISEVLRSFLTEVHTTEPAVILAGLQTFSTTSLDFVDCLLHAYQTVSGFEVITFDKKLNALLRARD